MDSCKDGCRGIIDTGSSRILFFFFFFWGGGGGGGGGVGVSVQGLGPTKNWALPNFVGKAQILGKARTEPEVMACVNPKP